MSNVELAKTLLVLSGIPFVVGATIFYRIGKKTALRMMQLKLDSERKKSEWDNTINQMLGGQYE